MTHEPRAMFSKMKLRCTKQRLDVYAALAATKTHPSAEELHRMVKVSAPGTSLATIYNTLEALCARGLCQKIVTRSGVAHYDADVTRHLHIVSDDDCIVDVPADLAEEIASSLPADLPDRLSSLCDCGKAMHLTIQLNT